MNEIEKPRDEEEAPIKRTPVEARQGGRSRLNLRVLVLSLGIVVVILVALYLLYFPIW